LADGCRGISHLGVAAVHVHDADVHEARGSQVVWRIADRSVIYDPRSSFSAVSAG
jgi:hypothetical protein